MPLGLLCLKMADDQPPYRIINLDLMATAGVDPDNPEYTIVLCAGGMVTLHQPFADFLRHVEFSISENYRIDMQTKAKWQEKYTKDSEQMMRSVLQDTNR